MLRLLLLHCDTPLLLVLSLIQLVGEPRFKLVVVITSVHRTGPFDPTRRCHSLGWCRGVWRLDCRGRWVCMLVLVLHELLHGLLVVFQLSPQKKQNL